MYERVFLALLSYFLGVLSGCVVSFIILSEMLKLWWSERDGG